MTDIVERLQHYVEYFDEIETKPACYELYYPIKNEGPGWTYRATGFGPSDIRAALEEILRLREESEDMYYEMRNMAERCDT